MKKINMNFSNIVFIVLWIIILLNFLLSANSFSDIPISVTFEEILTMSLFRLLILLSYSVLFIFLRKQLTIKFLLINIFLWFLLFIPPFFNIGLFKNYSLSGYKYAINFSIISSFLIFFIIILLYRTYKLKKSSTLG